jgi:SAM-dependent methyltransferase
MGNQLVLPSKEYESSICPLCSYNVTDVIFEFPTFKKIWPLYQCKKCDFSFIRPMPIELLEERKMESIEDAELCSPLFKKLHEILILEREIQAIRTVCQKEQIELLDIGCGTGWTSELWRRKGFLVEAVEPSKSRCDYARRQYGLKVHNCYVEQLDLPGKFDVVVFRHILEHLEHPSVIINSVRHLLKEEGVILAIVPNIDCIGRKIFGRHWEWVLPWHCNFFTPRSIVRLAESCGFRAVNTFQSPSPLYYGESLGRALQSPALESFFTKHRLAGLPVAIPLTLSGIISGYGDNVTLIARKTGKNSLQDV